MQSTISYILTIKNLVSISAYDWVKHVFSNFLAIFPLNFTFCPHFFYRVNKPAQIKNNLLPMAEKLKITKKQFKYLYARAP